MTAAADGQSRSTWTGHVLVVADGDLEPGLLHAAAAGADRLIAADGAAGGMLAAGARPDLVVGDGDSLDQTDRDRLVGLGVDFQDADHEKDESDTELCLLAALESGARSITIIGALGGARPEHAVANLLLLADPRLDGIPVELLADRDQITNPPPQPHHAPRQCDDGEHRHEKRKHDHRIQARAIDAGRRDQRPVRRPRWEPPGIRRLGCWRSPR